MAEGSVQTGAARTTGVQSRGARLTLRGLTKHYGEFTALASTDLTIDAGEFFSIIGPSGSGKSTLLGAIAGFVAPSGGSIEVDGRDLVGIAPYLRNIGMVFQNYALFPHMSVFDNVAFPLRLRHMAPREIQERVERMLATVRLSDKIRRRPSQLSGGQQQRVALARAAVYDPRILLMDEPLGALDKNLRAEMQYEIKAFHEQIEATILYVTHDQDEAAAMSDRIAIMNHGHLVQYGKPRELYENPRNAFAASFLGDANLFEITATRGLAGSRVALTVNGDHALTAVVHADALAPERCVVCVRPEAVRIAAADAPFDDTPDDKPGCHLLNRLTGVVEDVVFAAGTVRYRVRVGTSLRLAVRQNAQRREDLYPAGAPVALVWSINDTLLIARE
ncbi:ABC transporter ATP-binding protein [Paraburkholderia susongensis]|uniref:Putative spermidine/putrescine transport system ATP-binding protein n=1 Tax=Paraburkholderia susongensis TaxID=1515439 RepID=A0A1X7JE80_9BURK|nr:ABC transporter ATP-binding protein [Paraburkholderia susongensis]SMG26339.1 putative spermidine/putrescine transport system ATP-binding protein [Paraburkholderia susongensis]